MSSSSQSATRRSSSSSSSSTSYTYGIPGSQVTISLNKSGNHSLTLSRGPNTNSKTSSSVPVPAPGKPFCKVCYDAGLPAADYSNHYVKDQPGPGGKVVCPTLLAQKCLMCGVAGHTSSYCPQEARLEAERKDRERESRRVGAYVNGWKVVGGGDVSSSKPRVEASAAPVAPPPTARNPFGLLAVDSGDESEREREETEVRNTPAGVPKPVVKERPVLTGPPPAIEPAKPLTWAQRAAAPATKVPSSSSMPSASSSASVQTSHLVDTRFQLHALCHNIGVTQRGSSAKKAAATANYRGNAAAVARESSLKRKQESVTIPA